jgi:hypothetical protein
MPSRVGIQPVIYFNDEPTTLLRLISCERTMGGQIVDHAVLRIDAGFQARWTAPISGINVSQNDAPGKVVEVLISTPYGFKPVHFGVVEQAQFELGPDGEVRTLISKLSHKLFGKPIYGQRQNQVNGSAYLRDQVKPVLALNIVFNPMVEGNIRGNMRPYGDYDNDRALFVDIESIRSQDAIFYQSMPEILASQVIGLGDTNPIVSVANWTLAQAVRYLCVEGNQAQTYIANPTLSELITLFGEGADEDGEFNNSRAAILRNHSIPSGCHLPEALDALLTPYGYTWYVDLVARGERRIKIVKSNEGPQKTVLLQAYGTQFNRQLTNMESCDLTYEADDRLTALRVMGARKQVEATFELIPAWNEEDDSTEYELLSRDTPEWDEHPATHRVWRDWVLNEGADYTSTRKSANKPCDLTPLLFHAEDGDGNQLEDNNLDTRSVQVKRRRFLPTLTLGEDGKPIGKIDGITVEWKNGDDWVPIAPEEDPSWACRILDTECGISFVGGDPPLELIDAYDSHTASESNPFPRVRVTATIELDTPIESTYTIGTPGGAAYSVLVDAADRFHSRYYYGDKKDVVEDGGDPEDVSPKIEKSIYLEHVQSGDLHSTAMDSTRAINVFAATVGANWARALVSGTFKLEGLDQLVTYDLGDVITKIEGREINLNTSIYGSESYPQVVGISYLAFDGQWTTLSISAFRNTEQQIIDGLAGGGQRYRSPVHTRQDYK